MFIKTGANEQIHFNLNLCIIKLELGGSSSTYVLNVITKCMYFMYRFYVFIYVCIYVLYVFYINELLNIYNLHTL